MRTLYLVSVGLHLMAAATWIGSLTFFGAVMVPALRARVPAMMEDRPLAPDIAAVRAMIDDGSLLAAARAAGVEI